MDFSIEMLELIFNATEGLGIILLGDDTDLFKCFNLSGIDMHIDADNAYILSSKDDGIMCNVTIKHEKDFCILKFSLDEDIMKFEFVSTVIGLILRHNSMVRMKNVMIKRRKKIERLFENDLSDTEEDSEWL